MNLDKYLVLPPDKRLISFFEDLDQDEKNIFEHFRKILINENNEFYPYLCIMVCKKCRYAPIALFFSKSESAVKDWAKEIKKLQFLKQYKGNFYNMLEDYLSDWEKINNLPTIRPVKQLKIWKYYSAAGIFIVLIAAVVLITHLIELSLQKKIPKPQFSLRKIEQAGIPEKSGILIDDFHRRFSGFLNLKGNTSTSAKYLIRDGGCLYISNSSPFDIYFNFGEYGEGVTIDNFTGLSFRFSSAKEDALRIEMLLSNGSLLYFPGLYSINPGEQTLVLPLSNMIKKSALKLIRLKFEKGDNAVILYNFYILTNR